MTQQSYLGDSNNEAASSCGSSIDENSTATVSSDVYPFSIGQKEIVLNNDERAVIAEFPDNNVFTPGTNICIQDSTNVDVGNRTVFNRPVTIYQYINPSTLPELQNGNAGQDEVQCNKNVKVIPCSNEIRTITEDYVKRTKRKKITLIALGVAILLAGSVITALILKMVLFQHASDTPETTVSIIPTTTPNPGSDGAVFITREKWGGVQPLNITSIPAATLVVVKHTGGPPCYDSNSCRSRVREIQKEHMEVYKYPDISYNFLIGWDGKIYVGRGFNVQNEGRADSMDIAFIGNFMEEVPLKEMLGLGKRVIAKGANIHGIDYGTYHVVNHNQTEVTESPGVYLYKEVIKWDYYSSDTFFT